MRLLDLFCGAGGAAMGYHRAEVLTRSTYKNGAGMDTVMKPESPLQEIHRMKLVVRHFTRLSAASRLYLAARLLNTTQSELERRGFFIR